MSEPSESPESWRWIWSPPLLLLVVLAVLAGPVFTRERAKACGPACLTNVKDVLVGMRLYAEDSDGLLPPVQNWPARMRPYVKNDYVFVCPSDAGPRRYAVEPREQSYAMNLWAGEMPTPGSGKLGVVFDGSALYGLAEVAVFSRHNEAINVGYADGHSKRLTRGEFTAEVLRGR